MAWEYSDKTKELFLNAVHGGPGAHLGEVENADGLGEHGSIVCGDSMRFTFRVKKNEEDPTKDVITEAKYLTFGCTSAIAASEALCSLIENQGYTPLQALKITNDDIVEFLGGLPEQKIHCSVMGAEALEAAVFNWAQKRGVDLEALGVDMHEEDDDEGRIVCKCFSLSEPYLRRKIKELNLKTIADLTAAVKAGGACMSCHHKPGGLQDLLDEIWGETTQTAVATGQLPTVTLGSEPTPVEASSPTEPSPEQPTLSPYQFAKKVEGTIEEYVRPMLQKDGGDVEIVDIKEHLVYCRLTGACAGCAGASTTLKMMVERTLKEMVDERVQVIAV